MRSRIKVLMLGCTLAALAAFSLISTVYAASTVWFYPPVGTWNSYGYPSDTNLCYSWSHSIHTYSYRSGGADPDTYVYYYDVYSGSSSSYVWWSNLWLVDGWDSNRSKFYKAPIGTPFTSHWTVTINSWFNHYAYGETRFNIPFGGPACQGVSFGVYGTY